MLKSQMTCSSCLYGEPCGSFGAIKCIRNPESIMKRPEEYCGAGEWYDKKCKYNIIWGEWEREK